MNKISKITLIVFIFFLTFCSIKAISPEGASLFEIAKNIEIFTNIFKELNAYYVDEIEPGKLTKVAAEAMLSKLDPYTNYYTESDLEDYEFQNTGKYGGIGATLRYPNGKIIIGDVFENSPAQKAGIHSGDRILTIDNHPVTGKSDDEIGVLLKGSPGTVVNLKLIDEQTNRETVRSLIRGEIEISSVPYASLEGSQKNIAYVKLTQFTQGCSRLLRVALDSLKQVQPNLKSVIFDLRNNPGGLLEEAVNSCNLFIDQGQLVVTTKGKTEEWDKSFKTQGIPWDTKIPVIILINHSSASASEIVSGTLQDKDRAVVIGEKSYGKGLVQVTRPLGYNAQLKVTTAHYFTPSGRCIQALDYAHRNLDGSVGTMPDSMKKTYWTANGRKVLSGGGVEPDVLVKNPPPNNITNALYANSILFNYANIYTKTHSQIAAPSVFTLSSEEWNQFVKWLENKDYNYKTETEIVLDSLQSKAIKENKATAIAADLAAIKAKLAILKKQEISLNQTSIKRVLENEIVSRYYFSKGRIAHYLQTDLEFEKAVYFAENANDYNALINPKK